MAILALRVAPDGRGGVAGSAAVLVLALVFVALPPGWSPLPLEEGGSSARPALLLAGGVAAFWSASLDPARRSASSSAGLRLLRRSTRSGSRRRGVSQAQNLQA